MIWDAHSVCSEVVLAASGTYKSLNWCLRSYADVAALQVRCDSKILVMCRRSYSHQGSYHHRFDCRRCLTLKEWRFPVEQHPFGSDYRIPQSTFKQFAFWKVCRSKRSF
jgi:hypothetical protein